MRPPYLTGPTVTLRGLTRADVAAAVAWFPGPFPVGGVRAEAFLDEAYVSGWYPGEEYPLAIERLADSVVVGGVALELQEKRVAWCALKTAPWLSAAEADPIRAEALGLLVRWLRDDTEFMAVTVDIPADEAVTIAAAEALGLILSVRLRQHIARPAGRVDLLQYQALNFAVERGGLRGRGC